MALHSKGWAKILTLFSGLPQQKKIRRNSISGTSSADKTNKGLRHFSTRVCQKVEEKGCTTYNEVAISPAVLLEG